MTLQEPETENLFSYGTLQKAEVQLATFGRTIKGQADTLIGYIPKTIEIQDEEFARRNGAQQRNLYFTGIDSDTVAGAVLRITKTELELADSYEPAEYRRVIVKLSSGCEAWVYLCNH